jgi:hypothetical protein
MCFAVAEMIVILTSFEKYGWEGCSKWKLSLQTTFPHWKERDLFVVITLQQNALWPAHYGGVDCNK